MEDSLFFLVPSNLWHDISCRKDYTIWCYSLEEKKAEQNLVSVPWNKVNTNIRLSHCFLVTHFQLPYDLHSACFVIFRENVCSAPWWLLEFLPYKRTYFPSEPSLASCLVSLLPPRRVLGFLSLNFLQSQEYQEFFIRIQYNRRRLNVGISAHLTLHVKWIDLLVWICMLSELTCC